MISKMNSNNYTGQIGIICYISILILTFMTATGCAQKFVNPQEKLHSYKLRFTKLQTGTIPATLTEIDTFYQNLQIMNLSWNISGELKEYHLQPIPLAFAQIVDSLIIEIPNSEITYWTDSTAQLIERPKLDTGEWQVQISASIMYDELTWSRYSDAVPFYVATKHVPFNVPVILYLKFGYDLRIYERDS